MTLTRGPTRQEGDDIADEGAGSSQSLGVLRLRAKSTGNRVAWGEDVVDNEGAGKKKSKSESLWSVLHSAKGAVLLRLDI